MERSTKKKNYVRIVLILSIIASMLTYKRREEEWRGENEREGKRREERLP